MYNESGIIDATLRTVSEYMKKTFGNRDGYDYEVIFSDDGSTDGCRAKVESFGDENLIADPGEAEDFAGTQFGKSWNLKK